MQTSESNKWNMVSEIELVYRSKIKAAQRPTLRSSKDVFDLLIEHWNHDKIELIENAKAIFFSFLIIPVIIIYPLLKRVSNYPQLLLGVAFNWGVLVGFATQNDYFSSGLIFLFLGGVFLTIAYDTIYAFQDINDDKRIGIGSLAIILEKNSKKVPDLGIMPCG